MQFNEQRSAYVGNIATIVTNIKIVYTKYPTKTNS